MRRIEKDPLIDENTLQDNNNIDALMNFKYFLETLKLVIVIFNVSYFTGIFWIIYCDLIERFMHRDEFEMEQTHDEEIVPNFIHNYEIYEKTKWKQFIIAMYYSFTSLSTVGFGDFHPQDNSERIFCIFILLFGVAIFSVIMQKFIEMIDNYKVINADLDEGDELAKF